MAGMKCIDAAALARLSAEAATNARRRKNLNLHASHDDPVQRMCNAFEPGTYVPPHRHPGRDPFELFVVLAGAAAVLRFDDRGQVLERVELKAGGPNHLVELPATDWHTVVSLVSGTVLFEVKAGPYLPVSDKDFAPWAPREGEPACAEFEAWYRTAQPGARPPAHP
jgi:cupin fold WbuC family metalloprotein